VLASKPFGTTYIGVSNNLIRRVFQHREGLADGFRKSMTSKCRSIMSDMTRCWLPSTRKEYQAWSRAWKLDLIKSMNPEWRELFEEVAS
jgi:putative endonuclease